MKTEIVSAQEGTRAVQLLRSGEVVALPTETVYGLAGDALNSFAVAKIFEAKKRPRFDPLIVHLPDPCLVDEVAVVKTGVACRIVEQFWPGPLTIILPKRAIVPDLVTAGLDTVAVRVSAHPVFAAIAKEFGGPLAAPSANRFGRISPTDAEAVWEELAGRIPLIVDGGRTEHGVESTIVRLDNGTIEIVRRGAVTAEALSQIARVREQTRGEHVIAPGQLPSHYAPRKPLMLVEDAASLSPPHARTGLLAWNKARSGDLHAVGQQRPSAPGCLGFHAVKQLSEKKDLREAAANFFRYLRELDADDGIDLIVAEKVPDEAIGKAINDRLMRAAARH